MAEHVRPLLGYLTRLQTRMDEEGFQVDDSLLLLLLLVRRAQTGPRGTPLPTMT